MSRPLILTLERCLEELYSLYKTHQNLNKEEAQEASNAILECESHLKALKYNGDRRKEADDAPEEPSWEGENRRAGHGDRRKPGDRRRNHASQAGRRRF